MKMIICGRRPLILPDGTGGTPRRKRLIHARAGSRQLGTMAEHLDVAVVGAGPYGLSIGSQLIASGLTIRVFGRPMQMWRAMLEGMMLKSYGSASNLTAPGNAYPLKT